MDQVHKTPYLELHVLLIPPFFVVILDPILNSVCPLVVFSIIMLRTTTSVLIVMDFW